MQLNISQINLFLIAFAISFSAMGKEGNRALKTQEVLVQLIQTNSIELEEQIVDRYKAEFLTKVIFLHRKKERFGNDERFLKYLFFHIHRVYLKKYRPYQSFERLFEKGEYGCLTGTALYALFLEEFGYDFEIRETNFHVFLIVKGKNTRFLIESTNPMYGFISDKKYIEEKLKNSDSADYLSEKKGSYKFVCNINRSIQLGELVGLQYYNVATQYYNNGNFDLAMYFLSKSKLTYRSERQKEFFRLIVSSIPQIGKQNMASAK